MSWWKHFLVWFSFCAVCAVNPQPEPGLRPIDQQRLMLSSPDAGQEIVIAGNGGAAPGEGVVVARHLGRGDQITTSTADDGSFSATIEAETDDVIGLIYRNDAGNESEEITITVPGNTDRALEPPTFDPLNPPDRFGLVVVSGGPGAAMADTIVVASNLDQPATSSVAVESDGSFVLDVVGAANERVAVFVIDAADRSQASASVTEQIPEPTAEDCVNDVDDDGDGLTDCDDPDCEDLCRCPDGLTFCDGICTDILGDPDNCGRCGRVCPDTEPNCVRGECYP